MPSKKKLDITDGVIVELMNEFPDLTAIELIKEFNKKYDDFQKDSVVFMKKWKLVYKGLNYIKKNKDKLALQVKYLKQLPFFPQRSAEWFKMREDCVSASSWGQALGFVPYKDSTPNMLIRSKVAPETMPPFDETHTRWGVKYEEVATRTYEAKVGIPVDEFSLIVHPKYKFLGASPDGIRPDGVMLEIKCPPKRVITGVPPIYYWIQMQGQLEVCDLEMCDFLECKITEFNTEDEFWLCDNEMKGIVSNFVNEDGKESFGYYTIPFKADGSEEWIKEEQSKPNFHSVSFWQIEKYSCVPVFRDREWFAEALPKLEEFWNKVLHHRKVGLDDSFFTKKELEDKHENEREKLSVKEIIDIIENKYGGDISALYADPDVPHDVFLYIESGAYIPSEEKTSTWD